MRVVMMTTTLASQYPSEEWPRLLPRGRELELSSTNYYPIGPGRNEKDRNNSKKNLKKKKLPKNPSFLEERLDYKRIVADAYSQRLV